MYVLHVHYMYTTCTSNLQFFLSFSLPPSLPPSLPLSLPPSLPPSFPQLECCGVNSSSNWEVNPNVMTYPDSCCPGSFNTSADPPCSEPFADVRACFFIGWVCGGGGGGGGGGGVVYVHVHKMKSLCSPLSLSPSLPLSLPPSPPLSLPPSLPPSLRDVNKLSQTSSSRTS